MESGAIPEQAQRWFAGRDLSPLEPGVMIRWQVKAQARVLWNNYRAELATDGRLWAVFQPAEGGADAAFSEPFPAEPTAVLSPDEVAALAGELDGEGFFDLDAWQSSDAEDGDAVAVRARVGGREHEVLYMAVDNDLVGRLHGLTRTARS